MANPTTSTVGSAAPAVTGAAPATTTVTAVAPTLPPLDGAALLQQAIASTGAGYHFNQTATVDGVVAVTVDGDRLPDGARLAISREGSVVSYVITPAGTWFMPENGEWEADDSEPPDVDPIDSLRSPTSVAVAGNDGTTVQLSVAVPLAALGIEGDGDTSLQVSIVSGALTSISYSIPTSGGKTFVATSVIGPVVDPSPVVAPI